MLLKWLQKQAWYQARIQRALQRQSQFYIANRINVLSTYRYFIKQIPKLYPRSLQQAQKLNELRWVYKNSKQLPNIYETQGRTNLALKIVEETKKGNYASLGDYIPDRFLRSSKATTWNFLRTNTPRKNYWWFGNIH